MTRTYGGPPVTCRCGKTTAGDGRFCSHACEIAALMEQRDRLAMRVDELSRTVYAELQSNTELTERAERAEKRTKELLAKTDAASRQTNP